jgi:hypothetical protein
VIRPNVRRAYGVSAAVLLALGAGCKSKEAPPPAETSTTTEAPAPPAQPVFMVVGVDLGSSVDADKKVTSPSVTFGPRDTIYASVSTVGAIQNANLAAKWTFQTGQVVDSSSREISPTGPAQTEFHIAKRTAWPVGKYTVEVFLNGTSRAVKQFEIRR